MVSNIWLKNNEKYRYIVKEVAILFESGGYKKCDKIILVTAPEVVRNERVMGRDGVTKEQVLDRMKNQWKDEDKAVLSDYIVVNTDLIAAKKDVDKILKELNKILL